MESIFVFVLFRVQEKGDFLDASSVAMEGNGLCFSRGYKLMIVK